MVRIRKRSRAIVISDDESSDGNSQCTPNNSATPATSVFTPARKFRTTPPEDAKFWVESRPYWKGKWRILVPPPPSRKPLSTIDSNVRPKRVQLSLDNFFSRPKSKENTRGEQKHLTLDRTSPTIIPSEDDSNSNDEDFSPHKKRKKFIVVDDAKPKPRRPPTQRKPSTTSVPRAPRQAADQSDLPPISSIRKMFDDLVARAGKLDTLVDHLNSRKLRVATMCSGTESPLLALRMITRSLFKQSGKILEIEHIFSCEIEPFKQAYIERNFSPPILFRDVLELANDYAYRPLST